MSSRVWQPRLVTVAVAAFVWMGEGSSVNATPLRISDVTYGVTTSASDASGATPISQSFTDTGTVSASGPSPQPVTFDRTATASKATSQMHYSFGANNEEGTVGFSISALLSIPRLEETAEGHADSSLVPTDRITFTTYVPLVGNFAFGYAPEPFSGGFLMAHTLFRLKQTFTPAGSDTPQVSEYNTPVGGGLASIMPPGTYTFEYRFHIDNVNDLDTTSAQYSGQVFVLMGLPEPSALGLLAVASLGLLARRQPQVR